MHREGAGEKSTSEAAVRVLGGHDYEAAHWTWRSRCSTVTPIVAVLEKVLGIPARATADG